MGACTAVARAFALHDSNRRPVPLEFSMAAIFSSRSRNLRGGGATEGIAIDHRSPVCAWPDRCDRNRSRNVSHTRHLCVSANVDLYRASGGLVFVRISVT